MTGRGAVGCAPALAFVFLSAGREVEAARLRDPIYLVLLLAFLPTAVPAAAWTAARSAPRDWTRAAWLTIVLLNLTTLGNWLAYLESIRLIGAVVFASIVVGLMPTMILVLEAITAGRRVRWADAIAALAVLVGILLIVNRKAAGDARPTAWSGLALAAFTSFSAVATNYLVGRLKGYGVGPVATFGTRFWGLLVAAVVIAALSPSGLATPDDWATPILFGVLGIAVPLFCLQAAIRRLGPAVPTLLIALHPPCVLLAETALGRTDPGLRDAFGLALICAGVAAGVLVPRAPAPAAPVEAAPAATAPR